MVKINEVWFFSFYRGVMVGGKFGSLFSLFNKGGLLCSFSFGIRFGFDLMF